MQSVCRPQTCKLCLTSEEYKTGRGCHLKCTIVPLTRRYGKELSPTELGMLVCNNFNERQMMPSLMNISFISFYIPNIPNLAYTSARLRAPPATSQKWLIISSRNIFSDAWRHLCSVWRDLEFRENVTRHNKLTAAVLSI